MHHNLHERNPSDWSIELEKWKTIRPWLVAGCRTVRAAGRIKPEIDSTNSEPQHFDIKKAIEFVIDDRTFSSTV